MLHPALRSIAAITLAIGLPALADQAVVPSVGNSIELPGAQEGPFGGVSQRRFMIVADERAFSGIPVGSTITGIRFRLDDFSAASGLVLGNETPRYFSMRLGYTPSVCTPNALANTEGIDGQSNLGNNSTMQFIVPASQLASIDVGSAITGMSLRNSSSGTGASFPSSAFNFTRFDVRVAPTTVSPLAMSDTFASNVGPGEIVVRDGPLAVPQNAFPASGVSTVPSEFAWFIPFDRAFIYQGGNICVTLRVQGDPPGNTFLDTDNSTPSSRSGMKFASGNPDALIAGSTWGGLVTRFAFTPRAFCPWDLNNDGIVNDDDFQIFVVSYDILDCDDGTMPLGCPSDFNYDRVVDDLDFQAFVVAYDELLCP